MKFYMTRHGNTNYNELGLCNDSPEIDVHLTPLGVAQADRVAEKLKDVSIDVIVVSPLPRTTQTAERINKYHHAPLEVDSRITDIHNGYEGKPVSDFFADRSKARDLWAFKRDGAESLYDVRDRVRSFLNDIKARQYDSVLVVTHQVILRQIIGVVDNLDRSEVTKIDLEQGEYRAFDI